MLLYSNATMDTNYSAYNQTVHENNSHFLDPAHRPILEYANVYRTVSVLLNTIIFIVGMTGNVLVIVVVTRTRSMHTPTNCYLMSLAFADCMVLLSATLPAIPETFFQVDEWRFGQVVFAIFVFLQYVGVNISALSITAFTVERYIGICHPIRAQTMCTLQRAKRIIAGIWIFGVTYCSPWLGLTDIKEVVREDTVVQVTTFKLARDQYLIYYMADFILFYIIPLLISIILYGLIARILFTTTVVRNGCTQNEGRQRHVSSRNQVVRMLAVIVGVFMLTWMPYRAIVVYNSFAEERYMDLWFLLFSRTIVYMNSAINPILYNAMSVKFRRAFKKILCYCAPPSDVPTTVYSEMHAENTLILARRSKSENKTGVLLVNGRAKSEDKTSSTQIS